MEKNGNAITIKKTFSRTTTISVIINADVSIIWKLLTNVSNFSRWNSTILSIEGEIVLGGRIKLKNYLDPKRTFKLKIKEIIPQKKIVWGDSMGSRTFTLEESGTGGVLFVMTEKIGSILFPLFANKIPSFDESFEKYAEDLKNEAELNKI